MRASPVSRKAGWEGARETQLTRCSAAAQGEGGADLQGLAGALAGAGAAQRRSAVDLEARESLDWDAETPGDGHDSGDAEQGTPQMGARAVASGAGSGDEEMMVQKEQQERVPQDAAAADEGADAAAEDGQAAPSAAVVEQQQ